MLYYLGKGTEFKKEECREYKTIEGALKAATKDEEFVVWNENGKIIGSLTDDVPEGALQTNADGSVVAFDADGKPMGDVDTVTIAEIIETDMENTLQDGLTTNRDEQESFKEDIDKQNKGISILKGKIKVTVICNGSLNLRRSPTWGNNNICGRAIKGQSYYVKEILNVDGKKMIRTIGDIYLSGASEHVLIEEL